MDEIRPTKGPFLFARIGFALVGATVLVTACAGVSIAAELYWLVLGGLLLGAAQVAFAGLSGFVVWRKERYEIHPSHLVSRGGGLFSDRTTELDVRNITHVKQRLPWLRYKLFDVGDVIVQSAGSSSAEVHFRSVKQPDRLYQRIRELMRDNGFSLKSAELLHSESPSTLGAIVEVLQISTGAAFFLGGGAVAVLAGLASQGALGLVFGLLAGTTLGGLVFVWLVLHFLDLKQRTYEVHDDVVEYREGFLSRTNAFIPNENIADAATRQTLVDQVLGLWDVTVSCQGSGSEVAFRRLKNGPALQEVVRERVSASQTLKQEKEAAALPEPSSAGTLKRARPGAAPVPASQAWTAELKPHTLRAILGGGLIRALATSYTVGPSSISSRFAFLGRQEQEFAYDKVTGVQVSTGPWDHLFGTFSVKIWSIGSSTPITLSCVSRSKVDLPALLKQAGIPGGEARLELPAAFGLGTWLRAHVVSTVFWLPWVLASLCTLAVPGVALVAWAGVAAKRQALRLHEHHVELEQGVVFRTHTYARYDDIKKVSVQRYVGTDAGSVTFFVAGETQIQTSKGPGPVIPNSFTAHYLPDVGPFTTSLDALLQGRIDAEQANTALTVAEGPSFQPALANSLVGLGLAGCFFPPLWMLAPYTWLAVKRRRFRVEAERAVIEEGVLYRTHTSVLFDRIDSLEQGQGMLGKAFGNGNVTLFTAGSSQPDLVMANCPEYQALYSAIRERYGR